MHILHKLHERLKWILSGCPTLEAATTCTAQGCCVVILVLLLYIRCLFGCIKSELKKHERHCDIMKHYERHFRIHCSIAHRQNTAYHVCHVFLLLFAHNKNSFCFPRTLFIIEMSSLFN